MTTLLIIDTSGARCALAIFRDGQWFEDTQNIERMHNRVVLSQLERLSERAGVADRRFTAVAFAAGPGSFTGIRIAAAVAQGIAFAGDACVLPLSSSLALARTLEATGAAAPGADGLARAQHARIATVIHSRRDACYLAGYRHDAEGFFAEVGDHLHQGTEPPAWLVEGDWTVTGLRPEWWNRMPGDREFLALPGPALATLGQMAQEALARDAGLAPEAALPRYVHGDSPWQPAAR